MKIKWLASFFYISLLCFPVFAWSQNFASKHTILVISDKHIRNLGRYKHLTDDTTRIALLGQGYNSQTEEYLTQCVSNSALNVQYNGHASSSPHQEINMSFRQLSDVLDGKASGSVSFASFSGSGSFEYASRAQSTSMSVTFTHYVDYQNILVTLSTPYLAPSGYSLINQQTGAVSPLAGATCGDSFVSGLSMGAKLIITAKISLMDSSEVRDISGKLDINVPAFGSLMGYLKWMRNDAARNKSISIYIEQIGGDESQLPLAIPREALQCGLDDLESRNACIKTLEALIDYEQKIFIPSITSLKYEPENLHGLAIIDNKISSYARNAIHYNNQAGEEVAVSLDPSFDPILEGVLPGRLYLKTKYNFERDVYTKTQDLLTTRLGEFRRNQIQGIATSALQNMNKYAFAGNSCYRDMPNCLHNKQQAELSVIKYDPGILDQNDIQPLYDISGIWINYSLNKSLNIAQIGLNTDAIYAGNPLYLQHDSGTYVANNLIQALSENIIFVKGDGGKTACSFVTKVIYKLDLTGTKSLLTVYSRNLKNTCGVPETQCNLPGEHLFEQDCQGIRYENEESEKRL